MNARPILIMSAAASLVAGLAWAQTAQTPQTAPPRPTPPAAASSPAPASVPAAPLIDLNSASQSELEALRGVGPVRAEAIIKGRPYRGKDELVRKNILPQGVYDEIKDRVIARQS